MINSLKKLLIRTPLYKSALELQSLIISAIWKLHTKKDVKGNKTTYVISPYKTGTTYITSSFGKKISRHEPYHYVSFKMLSSNFENYFIPRLNFFNLKVEASGFLSLFVNQLAENPITNELKYVCILRSPSSWATSLINYNHHEVDGVISPNYNWTNEIIWKKHVGVNLSTFFNLNEQEKHANAEKLIDFYMQFTINTKRLKEVQYVWIQDLEDFTLNLGSSIGEEILTEKTWRRKGKAKKYVHENEERDLEYIKIINSLTPNSVFKR